MPVLRTPEMLAERWAAASLFQSPQRLVLREPLVL